jgi:hypothetical protein
MIDVPKTREALERAIETLVREAAWYEDTSAYDHAATLRALSAALGQAQEAWQRDAPSLVLVRRLPDDDPAQWKFQRPVLILPLATPTAEHKEPT